jgi:hypothetical protein
VTARMSALIRRIVRRMTGRNGIGPARPPVVPARNQNVKMQRAEDTARDAYRAVDSFTAAMERAMRGQTR